MKLSEYSTFEEKRKFYWRGEQELTINIDGILGLLELLEESESYVFRGCSEAKYKLYNSAQRYWATNEMARYVNSNDEQLWMDHYNSFIKSLIAECKVWNEGTVRRFLSAMGVNEDNSLAYLSYMQHNGCPSPFLDFTEDPYIALFFAMDGLNYTPSDNTIENYFSVYALAKPQEIVTKWEKDFEQLFPRDGSGAISYDDVSKSGLTILTSKSPAYSIINTTNIINQKGLFVFNGNPYNPLGETVWRTVDEYARRTDLGFEEDYSESKLMTCFNIHKALAPYLQQEIKKKGITREYVYPEIQTMKGHVIAKATITSTANYLGPHEFF